ncbi:hypothetical protein [Modestobacter sp. VKM Ac-2985]|uniref:hypothetical protein n=1 Tax=Modestobacter sp. VKM Ac-2985 TaxID=3004139 RepID=UPI0022AB7EE8|nr:hypothetical protein [Modestobacter sp. VKM Ac-2985]MCZ2836977.1 hypothetical protein [Modestobacter sp. VKM Ac-2985]
MTGDDLRAAVTAVQQVFARVPDGAAAVPTLGTDVIGVAAHITSCLTWYAQDLVAGPVEVSAFDVVRRPDADLAETCLQVTAAAEVLARVVDAAGPAERGAHDWGLADASGFAGMGCAELLLHTGDVAMDRQLDWTPPSRLAEATRARLFPWAPADADPWAALLWATGRGELPGREPVTSWRWHCAPLSEWDGTQPR